jgi:hypothetical protein
MRRHIKNKKKDRLIIPQSLERRHDCYKCDMLAIIAQPSSVTIKTEKKKFNYFKIIS